MVVMKNKLLVNNVRNIKKNLPRFLSLLIMGFLGVFAFAGLKATAPDMLITLDNYLKDGNVYDVKIVSSGGLTNYDFNSLKEIPETKEIEEAYNLDKIIKIQDVEYVISLNSIPNKINKLNLLTGRMPNNNQEIVVETNFLKDLNYKINDTISFDKDNLYNNEFKIVGTIDSPIYFNNVSITQDRGTTSVGSGTINYYAYIDPSCFDMPCFTSFYITIKNANNYQTASKEYLKTIDDYLSLVNNIKDDLETHRYQEIYDEALIEINENETKLNDYKQSLDESLKELDNNQKELESTWNSLLQICELYNLDINKIPETITKVEELLENETDENKINEYENDLSRLNLLLSYINNWHDSNKLYEENKQKYQESYDLYLNNLNELDKAKDALNNLPEINIISLQLKDYSTYSEYIDDTNSVKNLALLFPIVFYAVAILVSLISMNRMVSNDRGEIGTLKSLGYSNASILKKYLLFATLATTIGSILGYFLGVIIIPKLIFSIYQVLFELPSLKITFSILNFLLGLLIALICIIGSTLYTAFKVLKERPSELLRPKAPVAGKRVLLEKIPFIWNRLNFSKKITIRNLFRYFKRGLITIFSIAGTTALLLCGFAIKDSITDIPTRQFSEVFSFDATLQVSDLSQEDEEIFNNSLVKDYTKTCSINAKVNNLNVIIMVFENDNEINKVINLKDYKTKEKVSLKENEIVISEKLASLKNLKIGDNLEILTDDNKLLNYKISSIVSNYINHYIFMDQKTFESQNETFKCNTIYLNTLTLNDTQKKLLSSQILENEQILNFQYADQLEIKIENMLKSLDKVVLILIVLSALLALVVLYNLSNININERKREISTLKVLGFYNSEVDAYITKETVILTILGIIIGLIFGYFLSMGVITTIEIEKARFIKQIHFLSYLYSILIALFFTFIVNFITHFILKNINMIDSLKSVE